MSSALLDITLSANQHELLLWFLRLGFFSSIAVLATFHLRIIDNTLVHQIDLRSAMPLFQLHKQSDTSLKGAKAVSNVSGKLLLKAGDGTWFTILSLSGLT
jgi:hypothetical protein